MRKPKLTYRMVEQAVEMKSHGMSNADVCRGLGVSETAWYKWLKDPDSKVKVALVEGIKKAEAEYKETLLQSIMATATREKNPQWTAAAWLLERKYPDEFGKAERQRAALGSRYDEVQAEVNRILAGGSGEDAAQAPGADDLDDLARRVIAGEFGNGAAREAALGDRYAEVQARVNEILGAGGSSGGSSGDVDIDSLARAVIRGDYGNGAERKRRLGALYDAVQARVNEILL